jgi:NAD(P)H-hydrate epimerase
LEFQMILVTAGEMQEMDRQAIETHGIPGLELMENAGRGAADVLLDQFAGSIKTGVSIICGKGNNGGDGFVIARYLAERRIDVTVYLLAKATKVKGDAAANLKRLAALKIPVIEIGFFKTVINFINDLNRSGIPVFAVDMPSGLNSDTGQPCGTCIRAQGTATFALAKIGHYTYPGADYTGKLEIIDIGIPAPVVESVGPKQYLLTAERIRAALPLRSAETHKGRTGHLLVVAGSTGKTGAAAMTAVSAMRAGAGLVTLGIAESLNPIIETQVMEVMTAPLPECRYGILAATAIDVLTMLADEKSCLAIGPGIGQAEETRSLVRKIISQIDIPLVIDADGLNNIAGQTQLLKKAKAPVVLTPHPGEMARLIEASSTRQCLY